MRLLHSTELFFMIMHLRSQISNIAKRRFALLQEAIEKLSLPYTLSNILRNSDLISSTAV